MTKYAYSIKTLRVREPDFPYNGIKLENTDSSVAFLRSIRAADNEIMVAVMLDVQNKVVGIYQTEGAVAQANVYPRNIIRQALLFNASAIILAHNHPSGHEKPSAQDITITQRIKEIAGYLDIKVHDHIILTEDTIFSMTDQGMI